MTAEAEFRLHAQFTVENLAGWNAGTEIAKELFKDSGTVQDEMREGRVYGSAPILIRNPWLGMPPLKGQSGR